MAYKKNTRQYREKMKAIRPYVDFNYSLNQPLHSSQKAKINRYFEAFSELQSRTNKVYRPRKKANLKSAQEFGQNEFEQLPGFKVAFLDNNEANPIERIRFTQRGISVTRKYFREELLRFNPRALAQDTDKEIARVLALSPGAFTYRIAAGKFVISQPRRDWQLPDSIKKLMLRYGMDPSARKHKNDKAAKNHYWANWLIGIRPMYPQNQDDLNAFRLREQKVRDRKKKKRRAKKERARVQSKKDNRR
jgi:hypothetical protein